jgi:23S rRNA (guanosine2251-2'-O)-methyltransferase
MSEKENIPVTLKIYGRQPVYEALRSMNVVLEVWLAKQIAGRSVKQIENSAAKKNIKIQYVEKDEIQKLAGAVVHQGVAAVVQLNNFINESKLDNYLEKLENPLVLILDQIQDPHNIGAILRTAEITGVDLIIIPSKGSAPINETVAKTSAGALFNVKIHQNSNLSNVINQLQKKGIFVLASAVSASQSIFKTNFKIPVALITGSEDKGVRKNIQQLCDGLIQIPQLGKLNSLNASVSTAVILYEIVRQRHFSV